MFSRLGRFDIKDIIGRGAMGEVYLGTDPALDREVAIKTIISSALPEDQARKRFDREAKAAGILNHPNIVTIHELGEDQGVLFIAMERLKGQDLEQLLLNKSLPLVDYLEILAQVCDGLGAAHRKQIIHRDIKPSNIMVTQEGGKLLVKIMDFGVARLKDSAMTLVGTVMGTVNYIAPEYIRNGEPDARSDLFAVGVMLYECIAGRKPFDGDTASTVLLKIVNDPPDPLDLAMLQGLSPAIRNMAERALAKDPEDRFQTADEFALALRAARNPVWDGKLEESTIRMKIQPLLAPKDKPAAGPAPAAKGNVASGGLNGGMPTSKVDTQQIPIANMLFPSPAGSQSEQRQEAAQPSGTEPEMGSSDGNPAIIGETANTDQVAAFSARTEEVSILSVPGPASAPEAALGENSPETAESHDHSAPTEVFSIIEAPGRVGEFRASSREARTADGGIDRSTTLVDGPGPAMTEELLATIEKVAGEISQRMEGSEWVEGHLTPTGELPIPEAIGGNPEGEGIRGTREVREIQAVDLDLSLVKGMHDDGEGLRECSSTRLRQEESPQPSMQPVGGVKGPVTDVPQTIPSISAHRRTSRSSLLQAMGWVLLGAVSGFLGSLSYAHFKPPVHHDEVPPLAKSSPSLPVRPRISPLPKAPVPGSVVPALPPPTPAAKPRSPKVVSPPAKKPVVHPPVEVRQELPPALEVTRPVVIAPPSPPPPPPVRRRVPRERDSNK